MSGFRTIAIPVAVAALTVPLCAGAAVAKPIENGSFHDEETVVLSDFCDVPGLTVEIDIVADGFFRGVSRGRTGLPYYSEHTNVVQLYTNVANGKTASSKDTTVEKDRRVTDNGDGTSTIAVLATGNSTLYDSSGKAIGRNPGQLRYSILIDNGGTPTDPTDDEFIEFLGVDRDSTGRTDDFCEAMVPALS